MRRRRSSESRSLPKVCSFLASFLPSAHHRTGSTGLLRDAVEFDWPIGLIDQRRAFPPGELLRFYHLAKR